MTENLNPKWERRAEFVNIILAIGIAHGMLKTDDVKFDGVAGSQFDCAVEQFDTYSLYEKQRKECLKAAIELGAPVEGLINDGVFAEKWDKVVTLCYGV